MANKPRGICRFYFVKSDIYTIKALKRCVKKTKNLSKFIRMKFYIDKILLVSYYKMQRFGINGYTKKKATWRLLC